jgi:hypothetical protein
MDAMSGTERRVGSKIFIVSLHRTGTQSLDELLESAGLRTIHWPARHDGVDYQAMVAGHETDPDFIAEALAPVIEANDALSDVPICAIYESLAARYPDARFLAMTRPAEDWVRSIRRHTGSRALDPYEKAMFWRYLPGGPETLDAVTDEALVAMHRRHHEGLRSFFAGSRRFKLMELYDPLAGEAVCDFLGLPRQRLGHVDYMGPPRPFLREGMRIVRSLVKMFGL